jgi:hypothetical protein
MIYRWPRKGDPRLLLGVAAAGTGVLLGVGACMTDRTLPSEPQEGGDDYFVHDSDGEAVSTSGANGVVGGVLVGVGGVASSSGGCMIASMPGCGLIDYDAAASDEPDATVSDGSSEASNDAPVMSDVAVNKEASTSPASDGAADAGEQ